MRRLDGSKFDVEKRDWRLVQQALPTRAEWEHLLKQAGNCGGMLANVSDWATRGAEHISIAEEQELPPPSMNHVQRARQEVRNLAEYVRFTCKRKAIPRD